MPLSLELLGPATNERARLIRVHTCVLGAWRITFDLAVLRRIHSIKPGNWSAVAEMWQAAKAKGPPYTDCLHYMVDVCCPACYASARVSLVLTLAGTERQFVWCPQDC